MPRKCACTHSGFHLLRTGKMAAAVHAARAACAELRNPDGKSLRARGNSCNVILATWSPCQRYLFACNTGKGNSGESIMSDLTAGLHVNTTSVNPNDFR